MKQAHFPELQELTSFSPTYGRPDPRSFNSPEEASEYLSSSSCSEADRYFFWIDACKHNAKKHLQSLLKSLIDDMDFDPIHGNLPPSSNSTYDFPALYLCVLGSWIPMASRIVQERIFPLGHLDFRRLNRMLYVLNSALDGIDLGQTPGQQEMD